MVLARSAAAGRELPVPGRSVEVLTPAEAAVSSVEVLISAEAAVSSVVARLSVIGVEGVLSLSGRPEDFPGRAGGLAGPGVTWSK